MLLSFGISFCSDFKVWFINMLIIHVSDIWTMVHNTFSAMKFKGEQKGRRGKGSMRWGCNTFCWNSKSLQFVMYHARVCINSDMKKVWNLLQKKPRRFSWLIIFTKTNCKMPKTVIGAGCWCFLPTGRLWSLKRKFTFKLQTYRRAQISHYPLPHLSTPAMAALKHSGRWELHALIQVFAADVTDDLKAMKQLC